MSLRHYEIVVLVHPDQSDKVPTMVERYRQMVEEAQGTVDRFEDWGRRPLAYPIKKVHKAHYFLMNITCDQTTLNALKDLFRYNDAVLRHLCLQRDESVTEPSPIAKSEEGGKRDEVDLEFSGGR